MERVKTFGRRPFTFDRVVRMLLGALVFCVIIWFIYILRDVLLPFGVAVIIAYLLEPLVQFNRRLLHLKGRVIAVFVTFFGVIFAISALAYAFLPSIISEMHQVSALVTDYASGNQSVPLIPQSVHRFLKENIDFARVSSLLSGADWVSIGSGFINVLSSGINFLLSVFNWFMVVLYVIFIMLDYDRLARGFHAMVPPSIRKPALALGRDLQDSMNHYFRGQSLVAFCVGILFSIGFLIMGLPLAVILGLFIGLLNMVPYLQLISIPVTALLCLIYSAQSAAGFWVIFGEAMAVYIIVQAIQDLFLTPKIMGKAMGLNPAIILLSLSIWGSLLGLLGMIIALPLTTLLLSYYERYVISRPERQELNSAIEQPLK
ncbi:MAG: AI-2E family transporter [Bacteroides sp.]|nr:AI-2E family transporter [Bacteroides sp.]MCM1378994.1 AI-2E family transporter [Bacteroides sp.]MCM1445610.1 AI-2E family transporter [Prevotella sp.]